MPRFHFNIRDDSWLFVADADGEDHPDLKTAIFEALASARHILKADVRAGIVKPEREFEITDENGQLLTKVKFKDALDVHPDNDN